MITTPCVVLGKKSRPAHVHLDAHVGNYVNDFRARAHEYRRGAVRFRGIYWGVVSSIHDMAARRRDVVWRRRLSPGPDDPGPAKKRKKDLQSPSLPLEVLGNSSAH